MIRGDLLTIGILLLTIVFTIIAISVTISVIEVTNNICREFPEVARLVRTTSIALLLVMWLLIAILALYALVLALRPERTGSITLGKSSVFGFIAVSTV